MFKEKNFKLQIRSTSKTSSTQISKENIWATTRVAPTEFIHGQAQLDRATPGRKLLFIIIRVAPKAQARAVPKA